LPFCVAGSGLPILSDGAGGGGVEGSGAKSKEKALSVGFKCSFYFLFNISCLMFLTSTLSNGIQKKKFTLHYITRNLLPKNISFNRPHIRYSFYIFFNTIIINCSSSMTTAILSLHSFSSSSVAIRSPAQHMKTEITAVHCYIITITIMIFPPGE
jgi:hypothetical protein